MINITTWLKNQLPTLHEDVCEVSIFHEADVVKLKVVKETEFLKTILIYDLTEIEKVHSLGLGNPELLDPEVKQEYEGEIKMFAHLYIPIFSIENTEEISESQFIDLYVRQLEEVSQISYEFRDMLKDDLF